MPVSPPAASASGPPKVKIAGEPRPRPEPAEGEEPPAKRPALVVHKSSPGKVPQKARPGVIRRPRALTTPLSAVLLIRRVRPSAVPPTSAPLLRVLPSAHRSSSVHLLGTRPLSPRVCRHLHRVLPTAHRKKSGDQSAGSCRQNPSPSDRRPRLR